MAFADPGDVAAFLGRSLTSDEVTQVSALLNAVEVIIRQRIPDLVSRVGVDELYADLVILVEAKAVRRVMLNPTGIRQHSEAVDDFTQSDTFDTAISAGDVYVTDDEWMLLGLGSSSAGSFSMASGYCE